MSDMTQSLPTLPQHVASIAEAMRLERFEILRLIARYPHGNTAVTAALDAITAQILGRNR